MGNEVVEQLKSEAGPSLLSDFEEILSRATDFSVQSSRRSFSAGKFFRVFRLTDSSAVSLWKMDCTVLPRYSFLPRFEIPFISLPSRLFVIIVIMQHSLVIAYTKMQTGSELPALSLQ